jgi:hypothetical protein
VIVVGGYTENLVERSSQPQMCDVDELGAEGRVGKSITRSGCPILCEDARIFVLACDALLGSGTTVARNEKRAAPVGL